MRVLFINTVFERGSTGRIVKDLGTAIEEKGGEYRVIYGRGTSNDPHAVQFTNKVEVLTHVLKSRIFDRAGFYSTHSTRRMIEYIRKYNPDIIHLHNLHGYYVNIEILFEYLKSEYKGKIVWTLHDCWAFTGHCVHYTWAKCSKWKTGCNNCPEKKEYPTSIGLDSSKKNYLDKRRIFSGVSDMTIITVSDWLKEQVENSFLKKYKIKRIYNGINESIFHFTKNSIKKENNWNEKKIILLVSDGWNERKGFNRMLEVATIAPKEWIFLVVGLTHKDIENLPNNVVGLRKTWNQQELIKLYSAADVFFNPSVEETFGLTTVEAMFCGTPAVVFDSTACPEIVKKTGSGEIININASPEEIIKALSRVMDTNVSLEEKIYSQESFINNYLNLYMREKGE